MTISIGNPNTAPLSHSFFSSLDSSRQRDKSSSESVVSQAIAEHMEIAARSLEKEPSNQEHFLPALGALIGPAVSAGMTQAITTGIAGLFGGTVSSFGNSLGSAAGANLGGQIFKPAPEPAPEPAPPAEQAAPPAEQAPPAEPAPAAAQGGEAAPAQAAQGQAATDIDAARANVQQILSPEQFAQTLLDTLKGEDAEKYLKVIQAFNSKSLEDFVLEATKPSEGEAKIDEDANAFIGRLTVKAANIKDEDVRLAFMGLIQMVTKALEGNGGKKDSPAGVLLSNMIMTASGQKALFNLAEKLQSK